MRKPTICICENKGADQLRVNQEADHAFVFATQIVQFLFFFNPKFQESSLLLGLYRPVCVRPGWNCKLLVFSCKGSLSRRPCLTTEKAEVIQIIREHCDTGYCNVTVKPPHGKTNNLHRRKQSRRSVSQ